MFFITNREPKASIKSKVGRVYRFDLDKNAPSNSVFYCERGGKEDYVEIGSEALMSRLRESPAKQLLFYIHGFSNLPEPNIFPRTETLQRYCNDKEANAVEVVPIIWPCDNDLGIIKDYWDDQKSADSSAFSFARVFEKFMAWSRSSASDAPCLKRINILAHSMGNRVLRETLVAWDAYDLAAGIPLLFRNTFLVAADIVNESLEEGQKGRLISQSSRNVSVYFASDDLALRGSKVMNLKNKVASRRLGHTGPENMGKTQSNVYAIDCDNINNKYDSPQGHAYFLDDGNGHAGVVFEHIWNTLKTGRVLVADAVQRRHILP